MTLKGERREGVRKILKGMTQRQRLETFILFLRLINERNIFKGIRTKKEVRQERYARDKQKARDKLKEITHVAET